MELIRRRTLYSILMMLVLGAAAPTSSWAQRFITVASTTSTEQSGLFKHMLPAFQKKTGIEVRVVALGTGQALDMARRGDADVVFVHAKAAEEKFIAEGYGVKRTPVMYNDFVLIGPKSDPAKVAGGKDILDALKKVKAAGAPFVSRGDRSGTHMAEIALWKGAGIEIDKEKGPWYRDTGQGMGPALNSASSMNAYILTDRGTWISFKNRGDLTIVVEGDKRLFNQYGVILVNPTKHMHVKKEMGQTFIDWVISPEGQKNIADYKIGGEQLFFPNANDQGRNIALVNIPPSAPDAAAQPAGRSGLRFDQREWSGAFGDLGTLVPFLFAYITIVGMEPAGMLLAFGASLVLVGVYFRTPFPVQPMKAIGAVAVTGAAQTAVVTPQAVAVAALVTGLIWLLLGATGTTERIVRLVGRPIIIGITLGLGLAFMLDGTRMMAAGIWLAVPLLIVTMLLLSNRAWLAMCLILAGGAAWAVITEPAVAGALARVEVGINAPAWPFQGLTWEAVFVGIVLLALPQVPLTLGNAVIAPVEYNNREFPDRPVTERQAAISTGIMNTLGSLIGAVPMCHGAGGMAAQVSFGARTGGAPIILGTLLVILALLFSDSIATLLRLFPQPALGVMLFLAGLQLALGSCDFSKDKGERFVTLGTAALSVWNVGVAFVFGIGVLWLVRRRLLKL